MNKTLNLDDHHIIEACDSQKMLDIIHNLPNECREAHILSKKMDISGVNAENITNVVVLGMGGSAIAGELIRTLLKNELPVPIIINKDYDIPYFVNENSLVIVISYSGNTEETLDSFFQAVQKTKKIITVSSGGVLKDLAAKNNLYNYELPSGFAPRAAVPYVFFGILEILIKLKLIKNKDEETEKLVNILKFAQKSWKFEIATEQNLAKKIATRFFNKIPVIYATPGYASAVALRWQNQLNENAKVLAHINSFPELTHNEIISFTKSRSVYENLSILFITDPDYKKVSRGVIFTKQTIQHNFPILEVGPFGDCELEKMFSLIYLGDFVSVYLAFLYQIDPTPIHLIDKLKEKK